MTDARQRRFWHRTGPLDAKPKGVRYLTGSVLAFGALLAAATNQVGCGSGSTNMATQGTGGATSSSSSSSSTSSSSGAGGGAGCNSGPFGGNLSQGANGGFSTAFDAAPNADGSVVYFTALDMGGNPGVFKQDLCAGGAATALYVDTAPDPLDPLASLTPFVTPFGIAVSTDGKTVFVSDPGAPGNPVDPLPDQGTIWTLSTAGGMGPTHLVDSVVPRSLTVVPDMMGNDTVYFTGIDKANQLAGVFKVPATGGMVTTIAEGPPFVDPSGVAVGANGDVYVVDTRASVSGLGDILVVHQGQSTASDFVTDLQVGYPAGVALMKDDSALLVSGLDPTAATDIVYEVTVATQAVAANTFNNAIGGFSEAAGLHRAHNVDVFAWADSKATPMGAMGTGTVFVIK